MKRPISQQRIEIPSKKIDGLNRVVKSPITMNYCRFCVYLWLILFPTFCVTVLMDHKEHIMFQFTGSLCSIRYKGNATCCIDLLNCACNDKCEVRLFSTCSFYFNNSNFETHCISDFKTTLLDRFTRSVYNRNQTISFNYRYFFIDSLSPALNLSLLLSILILISTLINLTVILIITSLLIHFFNRFYRKSEPDSPACTELHSILQINPSSSYSISHDVITVNELEISQNPTTSTPIDSNPSENTTIKELIYESIIASEDESDIPINQNLNLFNTTTSL